MSEGPPESMSLPAPRALLSHELATFGLPGLFRMRVEGQARPPAEGPLLLVANRTSLLDPGLLGLAAGRVVWTAAVSPLFFLPALRAVARRFKALPVLGPAGGPGPYARALDRGDAVVYFTDFVAEARSGATRLVVAPAFIEVLLAARHAPIAVVPVLTLGAGGRLPLGDLPGAGGLGRLLSTGSPPVVYTENHARVGRPVMWRDGGGGTLSAFRSAVEDSLGALV